MRVVIRKRREIFGLAGNLVWAVKCPCSDGHWFDAKSFEHAIQYANRHIVYHQWEDMREKAGVK